MTIGGDKLMPLLMGYEEGGSGLIMSTAVIPADGVVGVERVRVRVQQLEWPC